MLPTGCPLRLALQFQLSNLFEVLGLLHIQNVSYFIRKRLERKELLIAAQNQEIMQRHRVNRFLQKLDHEMEIKKKDEINVS